MRIVIITEGYLPELNGVCVSLHYRLKCLSKLGFDVEVYVPDYSHLSEVYPDYLSYVGNIMPGVTIVPYPSRLFSPRQMLFPEPSSLKAIESRIEDFQPDIIHVECPERLFTGFLARPGISLSKRLNVPVTAFYHTNYIPCIREYGADKFLFKLPKIDVLLRKMMSWVYNSYDLTMVPSKTSMKYLIECGIENCTQDRFLGVDKNMFKKVIDINIEKKISSIRKKCKILYVGRLDKEKQIENLLKIFDAVRERAYGRCGFIIVGGGEEDQKVKLWAATHGDVVYTGPVHNSETGFYYSLADIFVTASPIENYPLTILEAMASGVPVIGPNKGGVGELIEHGKTGFSAKPYDIDSMADYIIKLVNNSNLRKEMHNYSLKKVTDFSWENSTLKMLKVWTSLLGNNEKIANMDFISQSAKI